MSVLVLDVIAKVILAYLLGSVLGSLIIGKLRGGIDIRKLGSGNAGGTNALRTQGVWFAVGVMVIDVGKGWLAVAWLPFLSLLTAKYTAVDDRLALACAAAVVLGHVYPIWFGFRGGKGAATLFGVMLGLNPIAAAVLLTVWLVVLLGSGYVGLATMLAAISFPLYAWWHLGSEAMTVFGIAMAAFVVFTHRSNVARMRAGTENRSTRLWLLRPR